MNYEQALNFPLDQIVAAFVKLRDHTRAEEQALSEKLKPFKEQMDIFKQVMNHRLTELGANSVKTDHGTPYKTTVSTVRMVDWDAFHAFVEEVQEPDFLIKGANKTKVEEWLAERGVLPPGVELNSIVNLNVRT